MTKLVRTGLIIVLALGVLGSACLNDDRSARPVVIGSKEFPEQFILAEIIAQYLEYEHIPVRRPFLKGDTHVLQEKLLHGEVDLYPEYTGTALAEVLGISEQDGPATTFARLRTQYGKWNLEWVSPLGFSNNFAVIMREEDAQRAHVKTISEAASYPSGWVIGVGREFVYRKDGLQGLVNTYGLPLKAPVLTVPSPNDLYKSLVEKRVDMVVGSMTDPFIDILGLTVLDDDRKYFPQYDAALVVRTACLNSHPHLREALEKLSGKISDEEMRTMNHEVLSSSAEAVAKSFLLRTQLIK